MAIALHIFARYCHKRGLVHPDVPIFLDYWRRFIGISANEDFEAWVALRQPDLMAAASASEFSPSFLECLTEHGVRASEFHDMLLYTAEIVNDNLGTLTNEGVSRENLTTVAIIADRYGVEWPDLSIFAESRWADGEGWGRNDIPNNLETWKNA